MISLCLAACSRESEDETADAPPSTPLVAPSVETAPIAEILPDARQVIPGRAVNVPQPGEVVERLPAPPVAPPPPRPVNLGIVIVEDATRLSTRRGPVRLIGTRSVDAERICQLDDGRNPPCATLARTAMRRLVGQRTVSCTLTLREDAGQDHTAPCTLGDTDLSLWLIAQGWAYASENASADMLAAQNAAQAQQLGLWAFGDEP